MSTWLVGRLRWYVSVVDKSSFHNPLDISGFTESLVLSRRSARLCVRSQVERGLMQRRQILCRVHKGPSETDRGPPVRERRQDNTMPPLGRKLESIKRMTSGASARREETVVYLELKNKHGKDNVAVCKHCSENMTRPGLSLCRSNTINISIGKHKGLPRSGPKNE